MGLNELKQEIISQAESEAKKIISDAEKKAEEIRKDTNVEADQKRKKVEDDTKKIIDMIQRREVAATSLEAKKKMMAVKKEVLDTVFEKVADRLANLSDTERNKIIQVLLNKAAEEIDVKKVYCNKNDEQFINGFDVHVEEILGGIIAENNDATLRVDYSFEALLDDVREKNLSELVKILFK